MRIRHGQIRLEDGGEAALEGDSMHQDALRQTRALTFTEPYEHASEIIVAVLWIPALTHGVGARA